jgi:DMSO/TMAO reductase YedYZ heme-binding membrane subunit
VPFLLVFTASAAHRLAPSAVTRWLMANRRYLGLSVAASHFWHLVAIVVFVQRYVTTPLEPVTVVFGGAGFVFLGLMAATSTDRAQRALGAWWSRLHTTGVYVVWLDFIFTYMGTATVSAFHALMTLAFAAAWAVRLSAFYAARRSRSLVARGVRS